MSDEQSLSPQSPLQPDTQRGLGIKAPPLNWKDWRRLPYNLRMLIKGLTPHGLLPRALLIIVTPVLLLQLSMGILFIDRHWGRVTSRLAQSVAGDVSALIELYESKAGTQAGQDGLPELRRWANTHYRVAVDVQPGTTLPPDVAPKWWQIDLLYDITYDVISERVKRPIWLDLYSVDKHADLRIQLDDGQIMRIVIPMWRLSSSTAHIMMLWLVGLSLLLLLIAILFLRNQIRPIRELANAADRFGRGLDAPQFKPTGASEVRRAARAFVTMKQRIDRQINQRTAMLAGISHDLRTPITRLKLELAMLGDSEDVQAMRDDLAHMEAMLDEYLAFARGQAADDPERTHLAGFVEDIVARAQRAGQDVQVQVESDCELSLRQVTIRRCLSNLIENGVRYGSAVLVKVRTTPAYAEIIVEDNGPGIEQEDYEEAFKPFSRLDEGRNLDTGGVGLGLAIARDAARGHGGDLLLGRSQELGGLKATMLLPRGRNQ